MLKQIKHVCRLNGHISQTNCTLGSNIVECRTDCLVHTKTLTEDSFSCDTLIYCTSCTDICICFAPTHPWGLYCSGELIVFFRDTQRTLPRMHQSCVYVPFLTLNVACCVCVSPHVLTEYSQTSLNLHNVCVLSCIYCSTVYIYRPAQTTLSV